MSTARNNIVKYDAQKSLFDDASSLIPNTLSFNQGDNLCYDATAKVLKVPTTEADGATYCGVARDSVASGKLLIPYSTSNSRSGSLGTGQKIAGPVYGVTVSMYLKNGDALSPGAPVYLDPTNGLQHVQAAGTKSIGLYNGPAITGSTSTLVNCLVGARNPNDTLKF